MIIVYAFEMMIFAESQSMMHHFVLVFCIKRTKSAGTLLCTSSKFILKPPQGIECHEQFPQNNRNSHRTKQQEQLIEIIAAVDFVFVPFYLLFCLPFDFLIVLCVCAVRCAFETCLLIEGSCNLQFHAKKNYCHFHPSISLCCSFSLSIHASFSSFYHLCDGIISTLMILSLRASRLSIIMRLLAIILFHWNW